MVREAREALEWAKGANINDRMAFVIRRDKFGGVVNVAVKAQPQPERADTCVGPTPSPPLTGLSDMGDYPCGCCFSLSGERKGPAWAMRT